MTKTAFLSLGLAAATAAGQVVSIDEFDTAFPSRPLVGTSLVADTDLAAIYPSPDTVTQTGISVLGGERRATYTLNDTGVSVNDAATIVDGALLVETGQNFGHTLLLEYGFDNALNLSVDAALQFAVFAVISDAEDRDPPASFDVTFTLESGRGTMAETTGSFTQTVSDDGMFEIALGSFGSVDLSDIDGIAIEIDLTGAEGIDAEFDYFRIVPAPGSIALLGLGGFIGTRRRR